LRSSMLFHCRLAGQTANGALQALIAGAAAQMARQRREKNLRRRTLGALDERGQGHDDAWRAKAALERMRVPERLLNEMQSAVCRGHALDRDDAAAIGLDCQHQAGADRLAVYDHRTRAAHAMLAGEMRARAAGINAQEIAEGQSRLDPQADLLAIDHDIDGM